MGTKHPPPIGPHERLQADHEHGEDWITCLDCGAQWRDVEPPEQVSEGDGHCDDADPTRGDA